MNKFDYLLINEEASIFSAIKQMDESKSKLLIVSNNRMFVSLLSIGDIQRSIIKNIPMDSSISVILRTEVTVAHVGDDLNSIKLIMKERRNEFMPIIDDTNYIVNVIFWSDLFEEKNNTNKVKFNLPVIIMAGGKGSRLRPLTNVLPKPLIPIGNQTMLEDIMDRFVQCGCHDFYLSLNYKADFIKQYLSNIKNSNYNINYFQEDKPSGTAGSLCLLKGKINTTFFVTNCDIIIDDDYSQILEYHKKNGNEITIVSAIKNIPIPYGTLETGEDGLLKSIKEKPNLTYKINTGMYILEPYLLNEIPKNEFYHITFLIEKLRKEGRKVGVFPINEGSWTDVGNWKEYYKFLEK